MWQVPSQTKPKKFWFINIKKSAWILKYARALPKVEGLEVAPNISNMFWHKYQPMVQSELLIKAKES
jgi:hypothetical protein